MNSSFVETSLLVGQGVLEVFAVGQVFPDSVLVELVVLVSQSFLVVVLVRQVNLGFVVVENALGSFVVRAVGVGERFLQVFRLAEVLQDGEAVELALLVEECVVVKFNIFESLGSSFLQTMLSFLVFSQKDVVVVVVL